MPPKLIIIEIRFMFLGINVFWALLRAHFNPRLTAWAKICVNQVEEIPMSANITSAVLLFSH